MLSNSNPSYPTMIKSNDDGRPSSDDSSGPGTSESQWGRQLLADVRAKVRRFAATGGLPDSVTSITGQVLLKMCRSPRENLQRNRAYLQKATMQAIREIVIDSLRYHQRKKRTGGGRAVHNEMFPEYITALNVDVLDLNQALERLQHEAPHLHEVVLLRFFLGLSIEQTAEEMKLTSDEVAKYWREARAWLKRELS